MGDMDIWDLVDDYDLEDWGDTEAEDFYIPEYEPLDFDGPIRVERLA